MYSPGPSPFDIQTHLYTSFLQASTYDVALRVSGSWNAVYKLHRVVLIQSGFFRSLFTAGFAESTVQLVPLRNGTDEISVTFDDLNITRPAFEVCVSRLYGGGPPLHVSPNLISTTNHPLTPPFSNAPIPEDLPAGHHPATPRFLQSLLATAIYLSIPSVASQALSLILKTIGPTTILQYLNFACGRTIDLYSQQALREPQAAVGLEHVAQLVDREEKSFNSTEGLKNNSPLNNEKPEEDIDGLSHRVAGSAESSDGELDDSRVQGPSPHYGTISNKIGEACSCWLVRWAVDMLQFETHGDAYQSFLPDGRTRSKSVSYITSTIATSSPPLQMSPLWGRKGLTAQWIAAIVSADTLFIKNERERYIFARSVVELRRKDGILNFEENIWASMFTRGIYYANMTFEDLLYISQDISPTTKQPYVALSTLQAAQWNQSVLRHVLTSRSNTINSHSNPSSTSPPPREKELGVTLTTADILASISDSNANNLNEKSKVYFPVLSDSSLRIGNTAAAANASGSSGNSISMEELFDHSHDSSPNHAKTQSHDLANTITISSSEDNFFGILTPSLHAEACVDSDPSALSRWSPYPPYRFSVEFWDVDLLKEKSRLHSQTIWHAGNLFNVYVQIVRKKGQAQLGIYLHRQSNVDPIPASSTPYTTHQGQVAVDEGFGGTLGRSPHLRQPSLPSLASAATISSTRTHYSPSIHPTSISRSGTPSSVPNPRPSSPSSLPSSPSAMSSLGLSNSPATTLTPAPQQPYRDPRSCVSAYFSISCASATGTSQTRFTSSPDLFSVSQSWGWKSSTLRTEDFLEVGSQSLPGNHGSLRDKRVSFRATVLLGLV
uniref:BTB domain-containing protein n=1 Tax=Psilocybe cubensis TaxID=181762 RepID=A0A8H8CQL6_PSICU